MLVSLILLCAGVLGQAWGDKNSKFELKWTPEDYLVTGLDKYGSDDTMYSGYMPIGLESNDRGSNFFWLAMKRQNSRPAAQADRLIIWLNGGPGCSSMIGMMWENGPFRVLSGANRSANGGEDLPYFLERNPFSWNEQAHVLYLEQPIGTGFSRPANSAGPMKNEKDVAKDMFHFLQSFFTVFEELRGIPLFIAGESYAGAYIPWMADFIVNEQIDVDQASGTQSDIAMKAKEGRVFINLQGVAIGNGVIDDIIQSASYTEYAYYHGLIPLNARERIDREYSRCLTAAEGGERQARRELFARQPYSKSFASKESNGDLIANTFDSCKIMEMVLTVAGQPNQYNTATFNGYDFIGVGPFPTFFSDPEIQTILHVRGWDIPGINFLPRLGNNSDTSRMLLTDHMIHVLLNERPASFSLEGFDDAAVKALKPTARQLAEVPKPPEDALFYFSPNTWEPCSDVVSDSMEYDTPVSTVPALQFIMRFIRVLLYSGEFDLNCNTLGTLHTLENSMWAGRMWNTAKRGLWRFLTGVQGEIFELDQLSFLIVRNSGHLLPMDLPGAALNLISRFTTNASFSDVFLPSDVIYEDDAIAIATTDDEHHEQLEAQYESAPVERVHKEKLYGREPDDNRGLKIFTVVSILLGGFFAAVFVLVPVYRRRCGVGESSPGAYEIIPSGCGLSTA